MKIMKLMDCANKLNYQLKWISIVFRMYYKWKKIYLSMKICKFTILWKWAAKFMDTSVMRLLINSDASIKDLLIVGISKIMKLSKNYPNQLQRNTKLNKTKNLNNIYKSFVQQIKEISLLLRHLWEDSFLKKL